MSLIVLMDKNTLVAYYTGPILNLKAPVMPILNKTDITP